MTKKNGKKRKAAVKKTRLIFLETQKDFTFLFDLMKSDASYFGAQIFFPYPKLKEKLIEDADRAGIDIREQVWQFSTISLEYDNEIYDAARQIATLLTDTVRLNSLRILGSRDALLHSDIHWACIVRFHDHIVWRLRVFFEFQKRFDEYTAGNKIDEISLIPGPGQPAFSVRALIAELTGNTNVSIFADHLNAGQMNVLNAKGRSPEKYLNPRPRRMPTYLQRPGKMPKNSITFVANVLDRQYEATLQPLLPLLLEKSPVTIFSYAMREKPAWLFGGEFDKYFKSGRLAYFDKSRTGNDLPYSKANKRVMAAVMRDFQNQLLTHENEKLNVFAEVLTIFVATFSYVLICYIKDTRNYFTKVADRSSAVVALPGRILESNLLVGISQKLKIPTVEIQSGTLSRTKRFVRPLADEFFAIEPYSARVVVDYFERNKEDVIVTGGIKVEYDLSVARGMTQTEAFASIEQLQGVADKKIIVMATQPIGTEYAGEVMELAIKGCLNNPDICLVIKPHPNETESYMTIYRALAKKYKLKNFIILEDVKVLTAVVAADIVCTYFSTVGLEAFALAKPVICINPFDKPLPFDLVQLGVAQEVKNPEAFAAKIISISQPGGEVQSYDPLLETIRDGKAIERVAGLLSDRSSAYCAWASPMNAAYYRRKIRSAGIRLRGVLS